MGEGTGLSNRIKDSGSLLQQAILNAESIRRTAIDIANAHPTLPLKPILNKDYLKRIDEILDVVVGFDPSGHAGVTVVELRARYIDTGVLTKEDMEVLNGLWKIFVFEKKFHSDKETTLGRIKNLLGGLNANAD